MATRISGAAGSGKTMLGMEFLGRAASRFTSPAWAAFQASLGLLNMETFSNRYKRNNDF